jgi:hypothetical protein
MQLKLIRASYVGSIGILVSNMTAKIVDEQGQGKLLFKKKLFLDKLY